MDKAETELLEDDQDLIEEQDDGEELGAELLDEDDQQDDQNDSDEDDETEGQDDDEGHEIVLEGDDGSHPEVDEQRGIRKRINKLNAKVVKATDGQEQSAAELEIANDRIKLMQLALDEQTKPVDGPPDPNDFDDGVMDAEYIKAFQGHIAKGVKADMLVEQQTTRTQTAADTQLNARQVAHYKRADTLKVKDYDATEDKAIAVLGQRATNEIIKEFEKSPDILYYLGKNENELNRINDLILDGKTMKAVARIGVLEDRLKKRRIVKKQNAPDPDAELSGGGAGSRKATSGPEGATFE